jgi:long-chain acyl-CoA synthetase
VIPSPTAEGIVQDGIHEAVQRANARLAPQQRVMGFSIWDRGDFPRTNLQKVKRHDVRAALLGQAMPASEPARPADTRIGRLQELLASVAGVPANVIQPDSDLALDLNLDSLSQVELAVVLESEFGVSLEDGDLAAINTVAELADLIEHGQPAAQSIEMPRWARKAPARIGRELIQQAFVFALHRISCRSFAVAGREQLNGLPGAILLIANHSSHIDTPSILRALPARLRRRTAVAAAADYFYRSRPFGITMSLLLNTFPFSREGAVRTSLEYCGELADDGWSILVYPEGTRSVSGELQPFRSGISLLATELRLPVVPVAITGSHAILPKGRNWPRRGPLTVAFGCPIRIAPDDDRTEITKRLEDAVATLLE